MTTQDILKILELTENFKDLKKQYTDIGCNVVIFSFSNVRLEGNDLIFEVQLNWTDKDLNSGFDNTDIIVLIGEKTKSGYLSTKKINLVINDLENLTLEETIKSLSFITDAVKSKFDPFYYENNIIRKNASAWSYIADNHMQDDCR